MKKLAVLIIAVSSLLGVKRVGAQVELGASISIAPPELPEYAQPPCPTDGYLWSPGYWAYGPDGYYWVPGVWVASPEVGFLWTPGYWGCSNGNYFWNGGYWGPNVGFYGGVCYGYGYGGSGFYGGRWQGGRFQYNTAAWRVNGGVIHNTYIDRTSVVNSSSRSSFNGPGGVTRQPNAAEQAAGQETHAQPTIAQQSHAQKASTNRNQLASANGGHPTTTAKSSVGGERFNSGGRSISTIHAAGAKPAASANHIVNNSRPAATRPANNATPRANPSPQAQQHNPAQNRSPQPQNRAVQRQDPPSRGAQGGGRQSGGGGGGHPSGGGKK